jgi:hypothetical protein
MSSDMTGRAGEDDDRYDDDDFIYGLLSTLLVAHAV